MPRKRRNRSRVFWKGSAAPNGRGYSNKWFEGGRAYGDFRDLGGSLEALKPLGCNVATSDPDVASVLAGERLKILESHRRGINIIGRASATALGAFAEYHLTQKRKHNECTDWTLGCVQRSLERAVEFFGDSKPITAIRVKDVKEWAAWLREMPWLTDEERAKRDNPVLSDGSVRHNLNALSNLYARAIEEEKATFNPVAAWGRTRPKGRPKEARWLEVHEAALLLEACKLYEPQREDVAIPDLHALVATHLLTGGRPAEVRGLAVDDVSFVRKTITFREHDWRRLKTLQSQRVVPLWPQLEEILRAYLEGPNAPKGKLLFPSMHRRVRKRDDEEMLGDIRKALDTVAAKVGWQAGEIRPYGFRHTYCAARLQTLDQGAPVSPYTVGRELGHGGDSLVKRVYGHLGQIRARSDAVEYRASVLTQIQDKATREKFEQRFKEVERHLKFVA